jgi:hypothetical protein
MNLETPPSFIPEKITREDQKDEFLPRTDERKDSLTALFPWLSEAR